MINCNPGTVSTRLRHADLIISAAHAEDVLEIIDTEKKNGTLSRLIVQSAARPRHSRACLGSGRCADPRTSPDAIDLAEYARPLPARARKLHLKHPKTVIAYSSSMRRLWPPLSCCRCVAPFLLPPSAARLLSSRRRNHARDYLLGMLRAVSGRPSRRDPPQDRPDQYVLGTNPLCSTLTCPDSSISTSTACCEARHLLVRHHGACRGSPASLR